MATFDNAIGFVLENEGGFQANPNDAGNYDAAGQLVGTNFGITVKTARAYGWDGPMEDLPLTTAKAIYRERYWPGLEGIASDAVAAKILDYRVNFGVTGGTLIAQRAANLFEGVNIAEDGRHGPQTTAAINSIDPEAYMEALIGMAQARYQEIADSDPDKAGFLPGWLRRVVRVPLDHPGSSALLLLVILGGVVLLGGRR